MTLNLASWTKEMHTEARKTEQIPWTFGQSMIRGDLEEQVVDGLKALAHLWFLEFTDETQLPAEMVDLIEDCIEKWGLADLADLEGDDEDEDDEDDDEDGEGVEAS